MNALGSVEIYSIPKGVLSGDAMLKAANVELLYAGTVCAGKYVVVVMGDVADVNASVRAAEIEAGVSLIDSLVIPNIDRQVLGAIVACGEVGDVNAVGVLEFFSVCSCITDLSLCFFRLSIV